MHRLALVFLALLVALPVRAERNQDIVEVVSPAGIKAWLRQDASVPLVAINFRFQGGGSLVTPQKAGTATLAASMLGEGAGEWQGEAFRQILADNAISLSFNAGRDSFSGGLTALNTERDLAVRLLRAALMDPQLGEDALRQQKSRLLTSRKRSLTRPNAIAFRGWFRTAFGEHPYSRSTRGTPETVPGIEMPDIKGFLDRVLTRKGLTIGVAGDISPAELGLLLDAAFGGLPDHAPPPATPPTPPLPGGTAIIDHPSPASVVVFGHAGIARQDPDWYTALTVAHILGGSTFSSRLGVEVREKRGLAYGIRASLAPYPAGALLFGRTATGSDRVAETLSIIEAEWQRMADHGPTAEELADAKTYLVGSFPLSLDSSGDIASVLVQMQVYNLGRDYWGERPALFESITLEDAKRVAKRLVQPDRLLKVVVGQPQGVEPTLSVPTPTL